MKKFYCLIALLYSCQVHGQLNIMQLSENHCPGIPDTLLAVGDTSYVWYLTDQPDSILSISDTLIFMEPTSFTNSYITCASPTDTITVEFYAHASECFCDVYVPNHFTPDGDLFNEEFYAVINCGDIQGVRMIIYNRMSKVVFDETDYYPPRWNGRLNNEGEVLRDDLYVWFVSVVDEDGETRHYNGFVILAK
jgi:gliding motility-associated-like protein